MSKLRQDMTKMKGRWLHEKDQKEAGVSGDHEQVLKEGEVRKGEVCDNFADDAHCAQAPGLKTWLRSTCTRAEGPTT